MNVTASVMANKRETDNTLCFPILRPVPHCMIFTDQILQIACKIENAKNVINE